MTIESPAFVIAADSHSAALYRQTLQTLISGTGVTEPGGLAVTQNGSPNMSVNVAAGMLWMPGTLGGTTGFGSNINAQTGYGLPAGKTSQGMYCAFNDATVNLPISTADPTNPRYDIVCASVQDAQYAGSNNQPVLQVVSGSPNPSPAVPPAPASTVVVGKVLVAAGVTSIVTGAITDTRPILAINGGITRTSGSAQYPANPIVGDWVDDASLNVALRWNGSSWDAFPRYGIASMNGTGNTPAQTAGNRIQSATFAATFSASSAAAGSVTFPSAFNTTPAIASTLQVGSNLDMIVNLVSVTTTGFSWRAFTNTGGAATGTATVHWIAIGT